MDTIGFLCDPDHPAFWPAAERLAARGFDVEFFRPVDPIRPDDVASLSALVNGVVHPSALAAVRYADRTGVPTWNGFLATTTFSARLVTFEALSAVGCRVPDVRFDGPRAGYVAAYPYAWDGGPAESAPIHVERVRAEPVDYRYYAVDDGRETHMRTLRIRSELSGTEELVSQADVDVKIAASVRELLDRFDARGLAVDFTRGADDEFYAIRVSPVPTFAGSGMERRVADSVASLTTITPTKQAPQRSEERSES